MSLALGFPMRSLLHNGFCTWCCKKVRRSWPTIAASAGCWPASAVFLRRPIFFQTSFNSTAIAAITPAAQAASYPNKSTNRNLSTYVILKQRSVKSIRACKLKPINLNLTARSNTRLNHASGNLSWKKYAQHCATKIRQNNKRLVQLERNTSAQIARKYVFWK